MKAVGYRMNGAADVLVDMNVEAPVAGAHDLLVAVEAVFHWAAGALCQKGGCNRDQ